MAASNAETLSKQWLKYLLQKGRSEHTVSAYRHGLSHFAKWYADIYNAELDLSLVMPRDVRDWKAYQKLVEKAAPATINQRLVALKRFFTWAVHEDVCRENPADDVRLTRLDRHEPKSMKGGDLRCLLREARRNPRDYAMIELLAGTGLRVGEMLALHIGDIKLNERSGSVIVRQGKADNYREIPLTADVRKALAAYLDLAHPEPDNAQAPLWTGHKGYLKERSAIKRMLEKYAHLARIKLLSPHVLRHTFATRYLTANPDDIRGLARLLGHSNLNTVMIYTEPDMDTLTERLERVEALS